ncbi:uncharacterized protein LDX57_007556 [Aspergillus melleus]|uniref:uncharacterized protein n=1 Tax=Aspergillus melleus TaxID=138277 RepID=UPI001E8E5164|nr:uncharacterized protein LDX57_007556 [Aspergillus melleus]KAH8429884.1 hypothetical protein LDX57_007556 [Aspergillus melleus]
MASTSRLTFASAWGFESTGVKELEHEFRKTGISDCQGDYNKTDDVLVLEGRLQGSLSTAAGILSRYVEEHENKDLLDVPRIYRLEVPAILQDGPIPGLSQDANTQEGDLLALGTSQDGEPIPHPRVTKTWVSQEGGAGCYPQFHSMLSEISKLTGTEIAVAEDLKGIRVSGRNENDVEDALAKISRTHQPLVRDR